MGLSIRPDELIRFLESKGYILDRQKGTSHAVYKNKDKTASVPIHAKDIKIGTLGGILKGCEISKKELEKWLGR